MSSLFRVNLKDKYRVLMSEVLPYELPLWFSNEAFYKNIKNNENYLQDIMLNQNIRGYIPFNYQIAKAHQGTRILSIMHPIVQLDICNFYEKYQDLIIYYCGLSNNSLRFPYKVVSTFHKKQEYGEVSHQKNGAESADIDYSNFISFFKYQKFPFLYKFFESYEYNKLEKKFSNLTQLDISKCFHNIYTHSISWAIKSKETAKQNIGKKSFDGEFDKLMQYSNYSETNGILIGSEISRIFAEIILQKIDNEIINSATKQGLNYGVDYEFKRYVDDFFVYYNNIYVFEKLLKIINDELFVYKLNINESKTIHTNRPFITNITALKLELSEFFDELFSSYRFDENNKIKNVNYENKKANKLITKMKAIVKKYNVDYASISNYIMFIYYKKVLKFIDNFKLENNTPIEDQPKYVSWLLIDLDLLFFIHAMDARIVTTDKLAKFILKVIQLKNSNEFNLSDDDYMILIKKIFDATIDAIKIIKIHQTSDCSIEILNLILILSKIKDCHKLEDSFFQETFPKYFESSSDVSELYFVVCSLLLYFEDDNEYSLLKNQLVQKTYELFFQKKEKVFQKTELFLFWIDLLSCQYIKTEDKRKIIKGSGITIKDNKVNDYINKVANNHVGISLDWSDTDWLNKSVTKKIYKYAY